jgi:dihydropteroate synthase
MTHLRCGSYRLPLDRPLIMGIVNLTPDSFSGDGIVADARQAIDHARRQLESGAHILDIGAESSRPGAQPTPGEEELKRLMPVLAEVVRWGVPVSVDTCKPMVMEAALAAGASMINDITALASPGALAAVAGNDCAVCLMHMRGEPRTMQETPEYADVVREVREFLQARVAASRAAGIADDRLVLDPGFGFGKSLAHNMALFRALTATACDGLPLLVGISRKSMLGAITGQSVESRLAASIAAAVLAVQKGAKILRVHDVAETRDALAVLAAVNQGENT